MNAIMSERRAHGTGSIEMLPDGRARVRVRVGRKKKQVGIYPNRDKAERVLTGLGIVLGSGEFTTPSDHTVVSLANDVFTKREKIGIQHTSNLKSERSCFDLHVAAAKWASDPIESVTRVDVETWIEDLLQKNAVSAISKKVHGQWVTEYRQTSRRLSTSVITHALKLLHRVCKHAIREGIIKTDPTVGVEVPNRGESDEAWSFLTQAEIDQLLSFEGMPLDKKTIFTVAIYQGLRAGELWGLKWTDVHLDGARTELVVRASHGRGTTKGKKVRRIPLLQRAAEALRLWKTKAPHSADGYVFPSDGGGRFNEDYDAGWADKPTAKKTHQGWKTRVGIARDVRFHDLRHTCASALVSGFWGPPWRLEEVRDFMRHSDIRETQRYAHLAPDALHAKAAQTAITNAETHDEKPCDSAPEKLAPNGPEQVADSATTDLQVVETTAGNEGFEPSAFGSGEPRYSERPPQVTGEKSQDGPEIGPGTAIHTSADGMRYSYEVEADGSLKMNVQRAVSPARDALRLLADRGSDAEVSAALAAVVTARLMHA